MRSLRTSTLIIVSVAATALFYLALALLLESHGTWLRTVAGADASFLDRLGFPVRRVARDVALVLAVGVALYLAYGALSRGLLATRRIAARRPPKGQVVRELFLLGNSMLATGVQASIYTILRELGYTRRYTDIAEYGWAYAIFSAALFFVLADAWSYFWHLAYHRSAILYGGSHRVHHLSVVTTPWTSFQGSPFELLPSTLFGALMVMTVPLATPVLAFVMVVNVLQAMVAHGGIEIFPRGTATHPLGRWLVTPTYHQMHHELVDLNLGLYFTWWDSLMGTRSADYPARFARVTGSLHQQRDDEADRGEREDHDRADGDEVGDALGGRGARAAVLRESRVRERHLA